MKIDLCIRKKNDKFKNTHNEALNLFYKCSTDSKNNQFRFSMIDKNLLTFFPYITPGALKLYLYYSFFANNDTGESWHSIDTIGHKLGVTEKSITNWNRELEDLGLIYRVNNGKKSKTTFLMPLTSFAANVSLNKMFQLLMDLDISKVGVNSRVFGRFKEFIEAYIFNEKADKLSNIVCMHLKKEFKLDSNNNYAIDIYLYEHTDIKDDRLRDKIKTQDKDSKVFLITGNYERGFKAEEVALKVLSDNKHRFLIRETSKLDNEIVFEIMKQLTEDIDNMELPSI